MWKCDTCKNRSSSGVDPDSGPYHGGCNLFYWDESGPQDEAEKELWDNTDDPWKRCKDYKAHNVKVSSRREL